MLQGHTRPITVVKYNYEGDLLISASKDSSVCLWLVSTGECIGTYDGHTGAVYSIDITRDSKYLLTGSADNSARVWEVLTGRLLATIPLKGPSHGVAWAEGEKKFAVLSNKFSMHPAQVAVFDFFPDAEEKVSRVPTLTITDPANPARNYCQVTWMPLNETLLLALDNGVMRLADAITGSIKRELKDVHSDAVTCISFNETKTMAISSSKDKTAVLWDVKEMTVRNRYTADVPINSAAISPCREHVILGGGQDAMEVTTTAATAGKFETRFHDLVLGTELGRVRGHFGPIHTLAFAPDGWGFTSGAEDGFIRIHKLDADYLKLGEDDDLDDDELTRALEDGTFDQLEEEERLENATGKEGGGVKA